MGRNQTKCSECRRKKIRCEPRSRNWERTRQKCNNCKKQDETPCGPNWTKRDDPAISALPNEVSANEEHSIRDAEGRPRAPAPLPSRTIHSAGSVAEHRGQGPSLASEEPNGKQKRKFVSDEPDEPDELRKEANSLLEHLNATGRSYDFGSDVPPVHCRDQKSSDKYNKPTENKMKNISDEFHSLFMKICRGGLQLHDQGMDIDADRVFMKLMMALKTYRGLCDARKIGALRKIAQFFLDIGDQDEHERVLMMVTETDDIPVDQEDPCLRLADSFIETSKITYNYLLKHSKEHYIAGEPSVALPPIQRSAQHRNPDVTLRLMRDRADKIANTPPELIKRGALHIAATHGCEQNLRNLLDIGAEIDARGLHERTALFLAAAKGHEECCAELINCGANVNCRDRHSTTILEVAARAGHIKVVQQLVEAKAEVNPDFVCCTSSPLQAAIANQRPHPDVALYLMGKGGNVSVCRADGKNAIELADKRCAWLADILRQKERLDTQDFFEPPQNFSFDQKYLDFGPGRP